MAATYQTTILGNTILSFRRKSATCPILVNDSANVNTLTTGFTRLSDTFDLGDNPGITFHPAWTKGSGTILTLRVKTSMTNDSSDPFDYLPDFGQPTGGVYTPTILEVPFPTSVFIYTGSPSASIAYLRFPIKEAGARYAQLWGKSDSATGSVLGYVSARTHQ